MNSHRKLECWQLCRQLANAVYRATKSFPADERYGLTSQLRRAAVSAAANIAEGYARWGLKESAHGLSIALGSLAEVDTLIAISEDETYLAGKVLKELEDLREHAAKATWGMHKKMRR